MFGKACKRIVFIYFFSLISLFFFSITIPAQEKEDTQDSVVTGSTKNGSEIKAGSYLVSEYMETLEETHSPYASLISCPQPCIVIVDEGGWYASSFHEYYDCHGMESGREVPCDASITVDGDNLTLTECCGTDGPLHFIYVGNIKRFVAGMVIEGDYVDSEGKTYSFKEDGTAFFGDLRFQYEIGLDFVERWHSDENLKMRDYFQNSKTRELYEYEIIDGVISIYRTSGDMFQDVEPEPFLTLIKVGD